MSEEKEISKTINDILTKWYARGKPLRERSQAIWVMLLMLSTILFTMLAGITYVYFRPKIGWSLPVGFVLIGAAVLWVTVMLVVRCGIKRPSPVDLLSYQNGILTVFLFDRTINHYKINDITIDARQVKQFRTGAPAYTDRFRLTITHYGTPAEYDIIVNDAAAFEDLVSRLKTLPVY